MTEKEATEQCEELTYELAKHVDKIHEIRDSFDYIAKKMEWDDMLIMDFDNSLINLGKALSGAVEWSLEGKYRKKDIETMKRIIGYYEKGE